MPKLRFGRLIGPKAVLITAVLLAFMVGTAWAAHRPHPLMDYAPQETGIYDTQYGYLMEDDCRYCHGSSLADRHHYAEQALQGNCLYCHTIVDVPGEDPHVTVYRDCRYAGPDIPNGCHYGFDNGWHHNTDMAAAGQCTACHNPRILGVLSEFQDPTYVTPSVVTPSPFSCENCHWEQLVDTVTWHSGDYSASHPSTDVHYDPWGQAVANFTAGSLEGGAANQFEQNTTTSTWPIPAGPNSNHEEWLFADTNNGFKYSSTGVTEDRPAGWEKDILDNINTHHMNGAGAVQDNCQNCHTNVPGDPSIDPDDPILIRYCEKCHDIASLHRIPGHVLSTEQWGGQLLGNNTRAWKAAEIDGFSDARIYKTFDQNSRCMGCHGDSIAGYDAPWAPGTPDITSISPNAGEPGAVVTLVGHDFGEEYTDGCAVDMQHPVDGWVTLPVVNWTSTEIQVLIPAWVFPEGTYEIRVSANCCSDPQCSSVVVNTSNRWGFTVTAHPNLTDIGTSATGQGLNGDGIGSGPFYTTLYLDGAGFDVSGTGSAGTVMWDDDNDPLTPDVASDTHVFSQVVLTSSAVSPPGGGAAGSLVIFDPATYFGTGLPTTGGPSPWTDSSITCKLNKLWKDSNGDYLCDNSENVFVAPDAIPPGEYAVRVRTIYWIDKANDLNGDGDVTDPGEPANGKPDFNLGDTEDPANECVKVCVSDPVILNITNAPSILRVKPARVAAGSLMSLIGYNFGTAADDSRIEILQNNIPANTGASVTIAGGGLTIRLADTASVLPDFYNGMSVKMTSGDAKGQVRLITDYTGGTQTATVDSPWPTGVGNAPVNGDKYSVYTPGWGVKKTIAAGDGSLRLWSNTRVKFKASGLGTGARIVQVTVGGVVSNQKKFHVIPAH